jgi:hypothetical protein
MIHGASPATIRQITGLRHHPTFNELIEQYVEGGPHIPWNDDPELILRSPAISELSGMAAAADDRVRDKMALDRRNYFIREEAKKQGLDFHTVRGFLDTIAPWADHNKPMDDEEWDKLESDSDEDMGPPPPPQGGAQRFHIGTPRGPKVPSKATPPTAGVFNQSPPKPPPPPPRGSGFAAPAYSGVGASTTSRPPKSVFTSGSSPPPPPPPSTQRVSTQKAPPAQERGPKASSVFTTGSSQPPPPPSGRREQAQGIDDVYHLHMRQQAAQAERHNANTQRWLEHLLGEVQRMGKRHDEQNRAMEALSSKQNTMQDLLAQRMSSTRQAAELAEEQRARMTDQRFQQLIEQVGRLASSQQQQNHHTEMLSLLKQYLAEHAHAVQNHSAQMQSATLSGLSQKLGEVEHALKGMGNSVIQGSQGVLQELQKTLREHRQDMREGISAGLRQQEEARQAHAQSSKEAMKAFETLNENLMGLGAQTTELIMETQGDIQAAMQGMETLNSQQQNQAAATVALAQMQAQHQTQTRQQIQTAMGQLGQAQQHMLMSLMQVLQDPRMVQMSHHNQLNVIQIALGGLPLNQVQTEVLLALSGNKPVKPEALTYLLGELDKDRSETSRLVGMAARAQQAQLAIEDLKLPGAAAASSSQAPLPSPGTGLTPRLPDGSRPAKDELKPTNPVGLRQASPSPQIPEPPPWAATLAIRGKERPSVSQSREYIRHTASAIKGDVDADKARTLALQARSNSLIERNLRRERSRQRNSSPAQERAVSASQERAMSASQERALSASQERAMSLSQERAASAPLTRKSKKLRVGETRDVIRGRTISRQVQGQAQESNGNPSSDPSTRTRKVKKQN